MRKKNLRRGCGALLAVGAAVLAFGMLRGDAYGEPDLWVHPRGEPYDPTRHYKDAEGELYYHPENDLGRALGLVTVESVGRRIIRVELGSDLLQVAEGKHGELHPVLLYDSDGDGDVDRTLKGRIEEQQAIFDSPELSSLNLRRIHWQIGVRYAAGAAGQKELDRRYLASVASDQAHVVYRGMDELPEVGAGPFPPGLVILKHQEGLDFDLAEFARHPGQYVEDFNPLTRQADDDDWTVDGDTGRLVTHFAREDLLLVRTEGGFDLQIEWGDMPLQEFIEGELRLAKNGDGCYSSLHAGHTEGQEAPVEIPHRLVYCPAASVALFDAPDGYEIGLTALRGPDPHERTEASTSVRDNVRLYVSEIYPRRPSRRATGSVGGNIRAGFSDAGADLKDALRHGVTGTQERNIHTGRVEYRPSILTAPPRALVKLAKLEPLAALDELVKGVDGVMRAAADVVSAVDNSVVNVTLQSTVGAALSPDAADTTGDYFGAATQALAKNLPFGERSLDSVSPVAAWRHDRAFAPAAYTRTDTQLNIDRAATIVDLAVLGAIRRHNDDSGGGSAADSGDDPDIAEVVTPASEPTGTGGCKCHRGSGFRKKLGFLSHAAKRCKWGKLKTFRFFGASR
jgi:hypothetical protein